MIPNVTPRLIIGLGNPDATYANTRHNIGRLVIETYLKETSSFLSRLTGSSAKAITIPQFKGKAYRTHTDQTGCVFVPDLGTFMNESGPALERVRSFLKIEAAEVLLVHDDIDLPLDTVRISFDASAGGHNGVRSVIATLGTSAFYRLRIGIETRKNKSQPPADAFVLQPFLESEQQRAIQRGYAALTAILTSGTTTAMNTYNTRSNG